MSENRVTYLDDCKVHREIFEHYGENFEGLDVESTASLEEVDGADAVITCHYLREDGKNLGEIMNEVDAPVMVYTTFDYGEEVVLEESEEGAEKCVVRELSDEYIEIEDAFVKGRDSPKAILDSVEEVLTSEDSYDGEGMNYNRASV